MARHRCQVVVVVILFCLLDHGSGARAATGFADPAFASQWQAGEALVPNFWGSLSTAHDGQQESYRGGTRLVQYFDKGRMELDSDGSVTSGLLAMEMLRGIISLGDGQYEPRTIPPFPIVGDPDGGGPSWAAVSGQPSLTAPTAAVASGTGVSMNLQSDGSFGLAIEATDPLARITRFDGQTGHNVAAVFSNYRAQTGMDVIGYAVTEPFFVDTKIAGRMRRILLQVFERRALTYTRDNPEQYQVEMGNTGQQYYQWRYPPRRGLILIFHGPAAVQRGKFAEFYLKTDGAAYCSLAVQYDPGPVRDDPLPSPQYTNNYGTLVWAWQVSAKNTPGVAQLSATCTMGMRTDTVTITFRID